MSTMQSQKNSFPSEDEISDDDFAVVSAPVVRTSVNIATTAMQVGLGSRDMQAMKAPCVKNLPIFHQVSVWADGMDGNHSDSTYKIFELIESVASNPMFQNLPNAVLSLMNGLKNGEIDEAAFAAGANDMLFDFGIAKLALNRF